MVAPVNASDLEVLFSPSRKPMFAGKPAEWWHKNGKLMAQRSAFLADTDCRDLVGTVLELQRDDYWRKFSDDWGQFCQDTFGRPAEWVEQVVEGVRLLHLQKPEAMDEEIPVAKALAKAVDKALDHPLAPVEIGIKGGNPGPGRGNKTGDNVTRLGQEDRGNSQTYLLRRLARDAPDVLERVKSGEFKSARAAAIAAGIIRPVPTVRLVDDPSKVAAAIRRHLSDEQISQLVAALTPSPSQSPYDLTQTHDHDHLQVSCRRQAALAD